MKTIPAFWRSLLGVAVLSLLPTSAGAVEHEVRILLDLDADPGTGCLVDTVDGPFDGVEQVLITTVQTSSPPEAGTVTDVATSDCTDEVADTFSIPSSFDGGWPVGVANGVGGRDVVETYFPLVASVVADPSVVRLGVVVTDELGGEQALLTVDDTPDGEDILLDLRSILEIPTLGEWGLILLALLLAAASLALLGRRGTVAFVLVAVVLGAGVAWAAGTLDGLTDEWSLADQLASNGIVLFGMDGVDSLCFRVDVDLLFNQPPTITDIADQSIPEDGATGALAFTVGDPESTATDLTVSATSSNQVLVPDGNLVLGGAGANRTIMVTPEPNQNGMTDVTVTVQDPDGATASTTFRVTVTSDNDPPTISAIADQVVLEDGTTGPLAFTVGDVETAPGSLTVTGSSSNTTVIPDANIVFGGSGANRTVTVTPAANQNGGPVTVTVLVQDTDGGSVPEQFTVTVTPVNDAPSFGLAGNVASDEDAGPQMVPNQATAISPGPADEAGQTVTFLVTNDNNGLFSSQPAIDSAGTLTYTAAPNQNGSATVTVTAQDDGGTADGGSNTSAPQMFTITVNSVNDPPAVTASTISYDAVGNTLLRVDGADADDHDGGLPGRIASTTDATDAFVKAGPSDVDSATVGFQAGTYATTGAGSLTIDDDGDFHYMPAVGFTGLDSVVIDVVDGDGGMTPVTINITVSEVVWYVEDTTGSLDGAGQDKNPAAGSDGRSTNAFETLAAAEAASGAGHYILVFETDTALDEGITLKNGQKLYGQRVEEETVSLLPGGLLLEEIADVDARPQLHRTTGPVVTVDATGASFPDPVEIRHLDLESGDDDGVRVLTGGTNTATVLIDENVIGAAGQQGIDVDAGHTAGTAMVQITDNTVTSTGHAIDVAKTAGGHLAVAVDGNAGLTSGMNGIVLDGSTGAGVLTVTSFAGNSVHQDTTGTGVFVDTATFETTPGGSFETVAAGTLAVGTAGDGVGGSGVVLENVSGDLQVTDLDVRADGGTALLVTGTGELNAPGGTGFRITSGMGSTLIANGGPALDADPATVGLLFDSITSAGSATNGVRLVGLAGTVTASAGTITGSSGDAFFVDGGSVSVTYNGTINNASANSVQVQNLGGGGVVNFGGGITDTGAGILLDNNDQAGGGGTVNFLAPLNLTTAASTAFTATNGGTVNVTDPSSNNLIGTTTGTGVTIADTLIGGSGVKLTTVNVGDANPAAPNAANGILLTNVGANPFTATGGAIQNVTGRGLDVAGGTGNVTVGTSISTTATGRSLEVTGHTAGTVAVSGAIDDNGLGVNLDANPGGTINVTGSMDIDTVGANTGFNATNGGIVNVMTGTNDVDTSAGTGVAVNIANTTIGPSGVTFRSASANGAPSGIVLDTTGASGGLVITGDGSNTNNASGGTIASTSDHGIVATDTQDLSLTSIRIQNPGNAASEHGILATGLRGTSLLRASTITGFDQASGDGLRVVNNNVNLTELRVNNSTFSASDGNDGLAVFAQGSSNMTVVVENQSLFTDLEGDAIDIIAGDLAGSTATVSLTIDDNDFTNAGATGNGGIQARTGNDGNLTGSITNNTFNDTHRLASTAGVIEIQGNNTGSVNLTVSGNDLDTFNQSGINVVADDASDVTAVISGNFIDTNQNDKIGIRSSIRNTGATRLTIQNNQIGQTTALPGTAGTRSAIDIEVFDDTGATDDVRILIDNNQLRVNKTSGTSEVLDFFIDTNADAHLTVTNNTFTNLGSGDGAEVVSDTAGTTLCLDLRSNAAVNPGPTTGDIELVELAGTYSVEALASVVANNPGANIVFDPNQAAFSNAAGCLTP